MRFSEIKRFAGGGLGEVTSYLGVLGSGLRDLFTGLYQLDFLDNFQSFAWSGTIRAGTEVAITNGLKTVPTKWIVTDIVGLGFITRGDSAWTPTTLYIKNRASTSDAQITLIFFK